MPSTRAGAAATQRSPVEAESSVTPQINVDNATVGIEEQIAQAQRVRDALLKQRELDRINADIERLRSGAVEEPIVANNNRVNQFLDTMDSEASTPSTSTKRTRDDFESAAHRSFLKPDTLRDYYGKSVRDHREWVRDAEITFRRCPRYFLKDQDRILFSMASLRGTPKELWFNEEDQHPVDEWTWPSYTDWLLNLIEDPINRQITVAQLYREAEQKPTQGIREFEAYLSSLEAQLPVYTQEQLVMHLFTRLKPSLRQDIVQIGNIPTTRDTLLSAGTRLENNHKKHSGGGSKPGRTHNALPIREATGNESSKSNTNGRHNQSSERKTEQGYNNHANLECFNCGKKGHISTNCRSPRVNDKSEANRTPVGNVNQPSGKDEPSEKRQRRRGKE
jgi:hypothetical protein